MTDPLFYGPPAVAWAAAGYKLPAVRQRRADPGLLAFWLTLTSLALALTVLVPSIYLEIDHLTSVPNLARLVGDGFALMTAWSVQVFLAYLSLPKTQAKVVTRRLGYLFLPALVLLSALFVASPVREGALSFVQNSGNVPAILAYRLIFLGCLGLAAFNIARFSRRYALIAMHPALRIGLNLDALGGIVGILYVTHEGLFVISRAAGVSYPIPHPVTVTDILIGLGALLTIIGSTLPAWGPRVGIPQLYHWVSTYRSLRRLYPLWLALYRATPEIALMPPGSWLADIFAVRDSHFRLYRRVIEIRDGRLALRPYIDPRIESIATELSIRAGLSEDGQRSIIEAAKVAAAIQQKSSGRPVRQAAPPQFLRGGKDIVSEATSLERVAHAYVHSSIVRDVLVWLAKQAIDTVENSAGENSGNRV
ncbi:MAG TPA: MAB_1171c family putative transporter [Thermomicrobiaceae bacterium]|nr:MAB_1171c family putative transporter [Thermomicrobiaceae bacterium]